MRANPATRDHPTHRHRWTLLWTVGLLWACEGAIDDPAHLPTVEHVSDSPEALVGQEVTLTGEVDHVYSARAFELEELQWLADSEVLVLARTPIALGAEAISDDKLVSVRGRVHTLSVREMEGLLGWDLTANLEADWSNRPVVVAERVDALKSFAHWEEASFHGPEARPDGEALPATPRGAGQHAPPAEADVEAARGPRTPAPGAAQHPTPVKPGADGA